MPREKKTRDSGEGTAEHAAMTEKLEWVRSILRHIAKGSLLNSKERRYMGELAAKKKHPSKPYISYLKTLLVEEAYRLREDIRKLKKANKKKLKEKRRKKRLGLEENRTAQVIESTTKGTEKEKDLLPKPTSQFPSSDRVSPQKIGVSEQQGPTAKLQGRKKKTLKRNRRELHTTKNKTAHSKKKCSTTWTFWKLNLLKDIRDVKAKVKWLEKRLRAGEQAGQIG
ncbi:Hypp5356 [Branchiostoma lanceolatum]|uniref:Hypp5356 protein n=1 Tax=Branchiostoma lanceolatum TaxID=7740 RepID=A0A8K0AHH0_BRALA|nr:Hypp5356 [Branchiostoma lanceolatum]